MGQFDHVRRTRSSAAAQQTVRKRSAQSRTTAASHEGHEIDVRPAALDNAGLSAMYACCDPKLSDDAQITLLLNLLCGLRPGEIAEALFVGAETVEKRLLRGKKVLAASKLPPDLNSPDVAARLPQVQRALHLLFLEGFHGRHAAARSDLPREAIRLVKTLLEHPPARTGATYGLAALMCLKAARSDGGFVPAEMLERSNWDPELVAQGLAWLEQSARNWELGEYQIEAMIAAVQASAPSADETDWDTIVTLYDSLIAVRPSAVTALHRAMALGRKKGAERGLEEILSISDSEILEALPPYWSALGEFALKSGKRKEARHAFRKARELARNPFERDHYAARIAACGGSRA